MSKQKVVEVDSNDRFIKEATKEDAIKDYQAGKCFGWKSLRTLSRNLLYWNAQLSEIEEEPKDKLALILNARRAVSSYLLWKSSRRLCGFIGVGLIDVDTERAIGYALWTLPLQDLKGLLSSDELKGVFSV